MKPTGIWTLLSHSSTITLPFLLFETWLSQTLGLLCISHFFYYVPSSSTQLQYSILPEFVIFQYKERVNGNDGGIFQYKRAVSNKRFDGNLLYICFTNVKQNSRALEKIIWISVSFQINSSRELEKTIPFAPELVFDTLKYLYYLSIYFWLHQSNISSNEEGYIPIWEVLKTSWII